MTAPVRPKGTPSSPTGNGEIDESDERPTVVPDFDPSAFARDSEVRQQTAGSSTPTIDEARRLHTEGKHEEALFLVAQVLQAVPFHGEAAKLEADCRDALERECWHVIGSECSILVCELSSDEVKQFALDHMSGFLLSLLDGVTTIEGVLDVCGMPRVLALRHLTGLVRRGIVVRAR